MAKQTINVGTVANDRTGDTLRAAFTKVNSNFTELYNAGAANTGNITFEGTAIVGSTGILPQGSIELVPNDGLIPEGQTHAGDTYTSWGQYLNIFPTWDADAPHIHITAGSGENSDGDLFLGNDLKYVQVNHTGTISINTNPHEWTFTNSGGTEFPELTVNLHNGGNQTAQTLQFARNMQAVITGPTPEENASAQRIIIQGQRATGTGEGGDVYLWGGDAQTNGGDIKIYAGDADSGSTGQGGYVNIDGGNGFDNGGDVSIAGGYSSTNGGSVFISGGYGGAQGGSVQIGVSGGAHNTIFHHDGGISIPLGPGILKNVQSVSTGGLPPINITGNVVFADANAAGDHITLLLPTPIATGIEITVKNINSGGYTVNVLASTDDSVAIEALDGTISTTASGILFGNCHATWVFDGGTWRITNRFTT